jgi:hypothetical protein
MAFDSTIRLRQLNSSELSGYISLVCQSLLSGVSGVQTGNLTGVFYPLTGNPSGFVVSGQTGIFMTQSNLNSLYSQTISYVAANYYPVSNPSGYISSATIPAILSFVTGCTSGANSEFINFYSGGSPYTFSNTPRVVCSFQNSLDSDMYATSLGGILPYGFSISYSQPIEKSGYYLNVLATL